MRKFHLVDFAARFQKGFRNHLVSVKEVPPLVDSFNAYGCYTTYFFFRDDILTYMATHHTEGQSSRPALSIRGYDGKVWAPFLPLDLDHKNLNVSLEACRFLVKFFLEQWQINPWALHIYFSGSKGFHLLLDSRLFGRIVPAKSLPLLFAAIRTHLARELPDALRETVDFGIKDRARLIRLPNTIHEESGFYKIWLEPEEIFKMNAEEIREKAKKPQPLILTDETGLVPLMVVERNFYAARFLRRIRQQVRRATKKPFHYRFHRPENLSKLTFRCAGIQNIWQTHVEKGYRNNCAIRLASELRLLGLTLPETQEKLLEWNQTHAVGLPDDELKRVARSAYQNDYPYRYSCRDEILRHLCPLSSFESCQHYVVHHSTKTKQHD